MHESPFPYIIHPETAQQTYGECLSYLKAHQMQWKSLLLEHGALLFRGFPLKEDKDFAEAIQSMDLGRFMDYVGGDSPRNRVVEGVYTSTEAPPWLKIPLHNELSFSQNYPSHIFFFCSIAPQVRGETPIADARKVLRSINPQVITLLKNKGLHYRSAYHGGKGLIPKLIGTGHRSWQQVYETDSKEEVEKICRNKGIHFRWTKDDWLVIEETRPPTMIHPETKEETWFNQAHIFKLSPRFLGWWRYLATKLIYFRKDTLLHDVEFADGSPIPNDVLEHIRDKLDENTVKFRWQQGDLLVLDNRLAMHGRESFEGKRRILTAMTA